MADVLVIGIILVMVGLAVAYIRKEKKRGVKCIGCPAAGRCSGCSGNGEGHTASHCDQNDRVR